MSEDQFTKMFQYMQKEFTAVRSEIAEIKTNIDTYANSVDGFAKQSKNIYARNVSARSQGR